MRASLFGCGGHPEDGIAARSGVAARNDAAAGAGQGAAEELFQQAREHQRQGRDGAAAEIYRQLIAGDAEYVPALDELAWLLATGEGSEYYDPAEAVRLAEELVRLTHYRQRPSTAGFRWSKAYKVRCAHTLAVAHAAAGSFPRALDYARWSVEVAGRQHDVFQDALSAHLLSHSQQLLGLFAEGRAYLPPAGFERPDVPLRDES